MISKIEVGKESVIPVLIKKIDKCKGKNDSIYQKVTVKDLDGEEREMPHFDNLLAVDVPGTYNATIKAQEYNDKTTYLFVSCLADDKHKVDDYAPKAHIDINQGWNEILTHIKALPPEMQCLVSVALNPVADKFKKAPLNPSGTFSRTCGLMEATLKLADCATKISEVLGTDTSAIRTASLLYYIGKLDVNDGYEESKLDSMIGFHHFTYTHIVQALKDAKASKNENIVTAIAELTDDRLSEILHIVINGFDGQVAVTKEALIIRYLIGIIEEIDLANETLKVSDGNIINNAKSFSLKKLIRTSGEMDNIG